MDEPCISEVVGCTVGLKDGYFDPVLGDEPPCAAGLAVSPAPGTPMPPCAASDPIRQRLGPRRRPCRPTAAVSFPVLGLAEALKFELIAFAGD